jgi:hypothetical protein
MNCQVDSVERLDVSFLKAETDVLPRIKLFHRLPNLVKYHNLNNIERDLACFEELRADWRYRILLLKFQRFDELHLCNEPFLHEEITDSA